MTGEQDRHLVEGARLTGDDGVGMSPPLKAIGIRELAVVDDGTIYWHYLAMRIDLPPDDARRRARAVPAVAPWRIGRQLWAAHQRSLSSPIAAHEGPPYMHFRGVVPPNLLAAVDAYPWPDPWPATGPKTSVADWSHLPRQALLAFASDIVALHPWNFDVESEPFFESRMVVRRPDPGDATLATHRDADFDPHRGWVGVLCYFTSTDRYTGGDLVMTATGEHLRPERGDAVLVRGDVEHGVTPLTSGHRVALVAFKAEPRPDRAPLTAIGLLGVTLSGV